MDRKIGPWFKSRPGPSPKTFVLIDINTEHSDLASIGDDSELNTTTRYKDETLGIGWGAGGDNWSHRFLYIDDLHGATHIEVTYSGNYVDGMGVFTIHDVDTAQTFIQLTDAWNSNGDGQSLYVLGGTGFSKQYINVINRTDIVALNGATKLKIGMKGYNAGYNYTRRYIKNLILRTI